MFLNFRIAAQQIAAFLYIWNSVSIWICFVYYYDFVYIDADMAKKGVDCVKIIQSFYAIMEDRENVGQECRDILDLRFAVRQT